MACGAKNNALKGEVLNPSYAINDGLIGEIRIYFSDKVFI